MHQANITLETIHEYNVRAMSSHLSIKLINNNVCILKKLKNYIFVVFWVPILDGQVTDLYTYILPPKYFEY